MTFPVRWHGRGGALLFITARLELLADSTVYTAMATSNVKKSFVRTKLLEVQCGALRAEEPYPAVRILDTEEAMANGQGKAVQKKPTFYPNWGQCFDSHVSKGRQMGVAIHDQTQNHLFMSEVVTDIESLADQCRGKPNQITRLTVRYTYVFSLATGDCMFRSSINISPDTIRLRG